jgi:hypothetical protein
MYAMNQSGKKLGIGLLYIELGREKDSLKSNVADRLFQLVVIIQ